MLDVYVTAKKTLSPDYFTTFKTIQSLILTQFSGITPCAPVLKRNASEFLV